jgi:hypothetical protein
MRIAAQSLRSISLRSQTFKPATPIDRRPADEPQCDEAPRERRGVWSRPVPQVGMEDHRVLWVERDQRSTALVEDACICREAS